MSYRTKDDVINNIFDINKVLQLKRHELSLATSLVEVTSIRQDIHDLETKLDKLLSAYRTYKDNPNGIKLPDYYKPY